MLHILLPAYNASTWTGPTGNNTYLLPGRVTTLIDAGIGKVEHIESLTSALEGRPLDQLLITHGHSDHAGGIPAIVDRWPGVRVRRYASGESPIVDDESIDAGDGTLRAMYTPGHAIDHCCFFGDGDLFCGDLARLGGTIVIPAGRGGDLSAYLNSLARVRALGPTRMLPGHGPVIDDPEAIIDIYVRHRAQRDRQILDVLAEEPSTPDVISSRVYGTLAPEITRAAAETVLAHLIKLEKDGRVVQRDGRWARVG